MTNDIIQYSMIVGITIFLVFQASAKEQTNWGDVLNKHIVENQVLLNAIRAVETGGEADPASAIGDGGKALGHFQMHRDFYEDATSLYPSIQWPSYEDACSSVVWSERAVVAVWRRYRKSHKWQQWELCSVFHKGGGAVKDKKVIRDHAYCEKVQQELIRQRKEK